MNTIETNCYHLTNLFTDSGEVRMDRLTQTATIAETNKFIVLEKYTKLVQPSTYQTEADLERELIADLQKQGYDYLNYVITPEALLANLKIQIENLNGVTFTNNEWSRLLVEYINKPSDTLIDCTRRLHDDFIYDFTFDDGHLQNIYLLER